LADIAITFEGDIQASAKSDIGVVSGSDEILQYFKWKIAELNFNDLVGQSISSEVVAAITSRIRNACSAYASTMELKAVPITKDTVAIFISVASGRGAMKVVINNTGVHF
jgi:hypothetical protein